MAPDTTADVTCATAALRACLQHKNPAYTNQTFTFGVVSALAFLLAVYLMVAK